MSKETVNRGSKSVSARSAAASPVKNIWFVFGILAVALSVAVLLAVVARAISGDGPGGASTPPGGVPTSETTVASDATAIPPVAGPTTPGPTTPPTASPKTPTSSAGAFPLIDCLDVMAPADKKHIMSPNCAPGDLVGIPNSGESMRSEAAAALNQMFSDAAKQGITLLAVSGYRSYQTQDAVYASAVQGYGQAEADRTSARPGHSEHQLGTVMDVSTPSEGGELEASFGDSPAGEWVAENSYKYGFIISYPAGTEAITGYTYEPWHIRYFPKDTALAIHNSGVTITEYLAR